MRDERGLESVAALPCFEGLDFAVLSLVPAVIFVIAFPFRLVHLTKSTRKTRIGPLRVCKFVCVEASFYTRYAGLNARIC